jgi:hypothetical protein
MSRLLVRTLANTPTWRQAQFLQTQTAPRNVLSGLAVTIGVNGTNTEVVSNAQQTSGKAPIPPPFETQITGPLQMAC